MLKQRILSALVLLPLPILALYYETPWFELLCAVALTAMGWEWEKLVLKRFTVLGMLIAVTGVACVFMLDDAPEVAWTLPAVMTAALYAAVKKENTEHQKLFAFGMAYSVYPMVALTYMLQNYGFVCTIWLIGTVWAMDTGAYAFGKTIGGPKLCPKISPKKTWAGLIGGMATAAVWGFACAKLDSLQNYAFVMIVSAILAAVSQGGDLFESWIKRYLGVKDSGNLIPGHGGIFDRTDALLAVTPIVVLILAFFPELDFWG